jgi:hypothetical protein
MSLDFSVANMMNYKVLSGMPHKGGDKDKESWHYLTEALTFATMPVGINRITDANWMEFYQRLHMLEKVRGSRLTAWTKTGPIDRLITPVEVYMHIGLSTNASNKTKKQFFDDLFFGICQEVLEEVQKAPEVYAELGLSTMEKDEWHSIVTADIEPKTHDTAGRIEAYRKSLIKDPLGAGDENIGSVT